MAARTVRDDAGERRVPGIEPLEACGVLIFVVADVVLLARKFESRSLSFLLFLAVERGIVLRSENQ